MSAVRLWRSPQDRWLKFSQPSQPNEPYIALPAAEHAALVALLGEVSDALTFYADPESYRRQPGVVGSMGGWVPGDIPPEKRDEWLRESWARALNHDDSDASWRQEIDADTPGAVKHTIHEAGFMDHPPVITDCGRKAAANKARLDAAIAGLGGAGKEGMVS